jgi:D-alanyl-D-alanine carboxypeptidase
MANNLSELKRVITISILTLGWAVPLKVVAADASALKPITQAVLQSVVEKTAKDNLIPGVFVLVNTPQGEYQVSYGTAKVGTSIQPRANTHFRIASNTKTMTAAVIVQQAQEGKIKLSDLVSKYIPNIPNGDNITIADLLNMRSGLYNYTDSPIISENLDKNPTKVWTHQQLLTIAFSQPPYFKPGTGFHYSNTNYLLLGLIAEKIDNKPLPEIFQARLFKPLNMKNTLLPVSSSNVIPIPYSHGYQYGSSSYALVDKPYPADMQIAAKSGKLKPIDYTHQNPSYALAAGGAISTAKDLSIWIKSLVSGKLFNAEFQREWLGSLVAEDKPDGQYYGYGIARITFGPNSIYFHGGEMPGYNSFIGYDPVNNVTLIIWTNLDVSIDGELTANAVMLKMLDQIYTHSPLQQ